jgi:RNA polymerase sigma-70 factor (ECF subfamily)
VNATAATRERVAAFLDTDYVRVVGAVALATGDRQRAEDAVQDALVATLTGDTEPENVAGWITVVAINYVRQSWRRDGAQGRAYVRAVTIDESETETATVDAIAMQRALAELPERQRVAVVLHYFEGLSVHQIAETLHVTEGTIKTQLHRGREHLAADFAREVA